MHEAIVGWIGIFTGWILTLLYMKGRLYQFPLYNRIISWVYTNPMADSLNNTEEFLSDLRETIVDQILNNQPQLFDAIAKQRVILANQKREPVAIFLNPEIFKELLRNALSDNHLDEVESLYDAIRGLDMPIGHLGILPIYVTELLIEAPVFVAGGITWSFSK
ncbi:hypothetical protein KA005_35745 [bacterium]|nr:hypothetical protein [bacterium]